MRGAGQDMRVAASRRAPTLVADGQELRRAGGAMLAAATVMSLLPVQLGVGCPLRILTGLPCPLCGMTTSVVATVDLRLADALAANPGGVVAVVVAIALLVWRPATVSVHPALGSAALALLWFFQLGRFGFF